MDKSIKTYNIVFCIILFIVVSISSNSANENSENVVFSLKKEIQFINNSKLKKVKLIYNAELKQWETTDFDRFIPQFELGQPYLYMDDKGRIRKFSNRIDDPDYYYRIVEYYNSRGNLVKLLCFINEASIGSFVSNIYFQNENPIKIDSKKIASPINPEVGTKRNLMPPDNNIQYYHLNSRILHKIYNIPKTPKTVGMYIFKLPSKGDKTIINTNDVVLRSEPSSKSKIIDILDTMTVVEILSLDKEEEIGTFGKAFWYKIITKNNVSTNVGYVFGAFLEPVEVEVK